MIMASQQLPLFFRSKVDITKCTEVKTTDAEARPIYAITIVCPRPMVGALSNVAIRLSVCLSSFDAAKAVFRSHYLISPYLS